MKDIDTKNIIRFFSSLAKKGDFTGIEQGNTKAIEKVNRLRLQEKLSKTFAGTATKVEERELYSDGEIPLLFFVSQAAIGEITRCVDIATPYPAAQVCARMIISGNLRTEVQEAGDVYVYCAYNSIGIEGGIDDENTRVLFHHFLMNSPVVDKEGVVSPVRNSKAVAEQIERAYREMRKGEDALFYDEKRVMCTSTKLQRVGAILSTVGITSLTTNGCILYFPNHYQYVWYSGEEIHYGLTTEMELKAKYPDGLDKMLSLIKEQEKERATLLGRPITR